MKKPMIAVVPLYDEKKDSYWMLPGYMKGIEDAGGIPVILPLTTDLEVLMTISDTFDGFLFTGGQDVNPELYGEIKEDFCGPLCDQRDIMEDTLFSQVLLLDKPVLGICRGIQLFNVLSGGTLYQDLPTQYKSEQSIVHKQMCPYDKPIHKVFIEKESPLYEILKDDSIMVNSLHHQGIKVLSEQLECSARAEDGLIEAVYMPGKKFVHAVQWHPEYNYRVDDHSLNLFSEFVKACRK
ncbi:gamma-glutamyl-gamma-aminobutyrate hydrolase family protein [Bacillus sp. Marseille-P3661]|uniref:gamma-glutamyl-gamma-aminobutyrate hydrolase family protein n=1 Tax=Bacillus sp. Marseille-P3661 TaxID=1936234 RepID=UPI000C827484|nr:gamma-glutamyl-gamma-aminobutyrate hydrolase family protein [Bacillus sp. Marseille-P3661]